MKEAFEHARDIDRNLVDAQQTRRVLDRLVGYQVSPLLWDKVRRGLSAGRVQTVALRLIVDREREIKAFEKQEYWTIDAHLRREKVRRLMPVSSAAATRKSKFPTRKRPTRSGSAERSELAGSLSRKERAPPQRGCAIYHQQAATGFGRASCASA